MNLRRQITLFLPDPAKAMIEQVRRTVDPGQFAKIAAHLTLGYDDELRDWNEIMERLEGLPPADIRFSFRIDGPRAFEREGRGIYLGATDESGCFDRIRDRLLADSLAARKRVNPHVTLLHPRHARDANDGWDVVKMADFPSRISIRLISVIELVETRWNVVREFGQP